LPLRETRISVTVIEHETQNALRETMIYVTVIKLETQNALRETRIYVTVIKLETQNAPKGYKDLCNSYKTLQELCYKYHV
jgi:hypothetical protein